MTYYATTQELHRKPKAIMDRVMLGDKIIIMKYSKPVMTLDRYEEKKIYTKQDFINASHSQKGDGDTTLSQNFKQYIY